MLNEPQRRHYAVLLAMLEVGAASASAVTSVYHGGACSGT